MTNGMDDLLGGLQLWPEVVSPPIWRTMRIVAWWERGRLDRTSRYANINKVNNNR